MPAQIPINPGKIKIGGIPSLRSMAPLEKITMWS
jgi:hypothetical protein